MSKKGFLKMRKKILFIAPVLPYPLTAGGWQALYNGIASVKDDVEVHFIYTDSFRNVKKRKKEKLDNLLEGKVIFVRYKRPFFKSYFGLCCFIRNFFANLFKIPKKSKSYLFQIMNEKYIPISQEYIDFINGYINKEKIDIVQFEFLTELSKVLIIPPSVKKIFVHHEIGFVVNDLLLKSVGHTEYRDAVIELLNIQEIGLLNRCDAVITLSEIDKKKLVDAGVKVPIYSSFAVVNTDKKITNTYESYNTLSFVGPSHHSPNYIGIKWFLENCWEKLLSEDSSYNLKIIGNWSEDKREELSKKYKNIEFLGFVSNLADALNHTIMIVPITVGSGIRMKILEASSLGIPFVSTTIGAEGLPFESGRDCFKADTPESFVKAIVDLKDKSLREKFAQNANAIVKEKYSIEALRKNRLEIYDKVLGDAKS